MFWRRLGQFLGVVPTPEPKRYWLSWYVQPGQGKPTEWLCRDPEGEGWYYSRDVMAAWPFDSYSEALLVTPKYDGSAGIEKRAGVIRC